LNATTGKQANHLQGNPETHLDLWCATIGICIKLLFRNPGKIPVESATDNYGRTAVCAECGDKTGLNKCYRFDKKCETTVSPTGKARQITPTAWQNPYFKEQITVIGLSGITPQI